MSEALALLGDELRERVRAAGVADTTCEEILGNVGSVRFQHFMQEYLERHEQEMRDAGITAEDLQRLITARQELQAWLDRYRDLLEKTDSAESMQFDIDFLDPATWIGHAAYSVQYGRAKKRDPEVAKQKRQKRAEQKRAKQEREQQRLEVKARLRILRGEDA